MSPLIRSLTALCVAMFIVAVAIIGFDAAPAESGFNPCHRGPSECLFQQGGPPSLGRCHTAVGWSLHSGGTLTWSAGYTCGDF